MFLLLFIGLFGGVVEVLGQTAECEDAPNPAAKLICQQIHRMAKVAKTATAAKTASDLVADYWPDQSAGTTTEEIDPRFPLESHPFPVQKTRECLDLGCVCEQQFNGSRFTMCQHQGKDIGKLVRKEYRVMSDEERKRFHDAFNTLKKNGLFDYFARIHSMMGTSFGAHSGPGFLPWHREFIKQVELELRTIDPRIYLPYLDTTLDSRLPAPEDSILFLDELMGTGHGAVIDGSFANWQTLQNTVLRRGVPSTSKYPLKDEHVDALLRSPNLSTMLAFTAPDPPCRFFPAKYDSIEELHGYVHMWIGGDMLEMESSANDPIFYLHHAFVDLIWEEWRGTKQHPEQTDKDYPEDNKNCSTVPHFKNSHMAPFSRYMSNLLGLRNHYTDTLYEYAQRPSCFASDCDSRFLFCDDSKRDELPRCIAKVRLGGNCTGFEGMDSCYNGVCSQGFCRPEEAEQADETTTVVAEDEMQTTTIQEQSEKKNNGCYNRHECCASWALRGDCTANPDYMLEFCKASCNVCQPEYQLVDDCADRHDTCRDWAMIGECTRNPNWMNEVD